LKTFDLLPADAHTDEPPPSGALLTNDTDRLPASMRIFRRETAPAPPQPAVVPPPTISFPPNGTIVPLPAVTAKDRSILFRADGGRAPLTWLVNGQLLGNFDRFQPVLYTPDGEGVARITVVDSQGRSDSAQVRFKKAR
jgi:penicillin-binding protein 1C